MQKILKMSTNGDSVRSTAHGWGAEDGDIASNDIALAMESNSNYRSSKDVPVGMIHWYKGYCTYPTPLHAIADGWKLLAPPSCSEEYIAMKEYSWWFVKD